MNTKIRWLILLAGWALTGTSLAQELSAWQRSGYVVISTHDATLDGAARHRLMLLARPAVDDTRMVALVFEGTEQGWTLLGDVRGATIRLDQIADAGRDGRAVFVLRMGAGDEQAITYLEVLGVRAGRLHRMAPARRIHALVDVDGDGKLEALSSAIRTTGFLGLPLWTTPRLDEVWDWTPDGFVPADRRHGRYHWRQMMKHRRVLERGVLGEPGEEQVGLALSLFLEHERLGRAPDGLTVASVNLRWIEARGRPEARRLALRAREALERRVKSMADGDQGPPQG